MIGEGKSFLDQYDGIDKSHLWIKRLQKFRLANLCTLCIYLFNCILRVMHFICTNSILFNFTLF
jgi:hypothetical protein